MDREKLSQSKESDRDTETLLRVRGRKPDRDTEALSHNRGRNSDPVGHRDTVPRHK